MWMALHFVAFKASILLCIITQTTGYCRKCPINEVYEDCVPVCPPRYCGVNIAAISCAPCPKPGEPECKPGCRCRDSYLRNANGTCIPENECPTCPTNEVYDVCPVLCPPRICGVDPNTYDCAPPPSYGDPQCQPGCRCDYGYLRNSKGKCVTETECKCDKPHEYYDTCAKPCPPQICESIGQKYACPAMTDDCVGDCRCEKGYYRNKIGECISEKHCLKCTGDHEYWSCGGACDNVCATLGEQNQTNCPTVNKKCTPMCYCEDGYARDCNNVCIPISECPQPCGKDERLEQCPASLCSPQTCSQLGFYINCTLPDNSKCPGPPGCVCNDGLVRDDKGNCIPVDQCPSCGGDPNAESGCGNNCGRLCSNYNKKGIGCSQICQLNGCDCRKGFVYDSNLKKCVKPKHCTPTCDQNEVWDSCSNGGCQKRNCSQVGQPKICIDPITCIGGCVCKEGYLRSECGSCIPADQCRESQCTKQNEHFDPCSDDCTPGTCDSIGKYYNCPAHIDCNPSCVCDRGYFRNVIGECISETNCLKCPGDHEYWSCGGACDNVCATLCVQNKTNCPIVNKRCSPMCYCEDGYARDCNNICIPIENCPPLCGEDERYEQCPASLCSPQSCSQLGFPLNCTLSDNSKCPGPPGCVCNDGLVRDDNGKCIPVKQCPTCGGDPNAESGCGINCGRLCSNYKNKNVACPLICKVNGCDCKKGFVYDSNLKKCVRPKHCTPTCDQNEVWDSCSNGGCQKRNCSQVGQPKICIDPITCIGGCVCKEGYLRSECGSCIPADQCRESQCTKQNEHFDPCSDDCSPGTCDSIGKDYNCPAYVDCNPSCVCDRGYYRNLIGECISEEDCLKCPGCHEYWSCGGACDNVCATLNKQSQDNCPIRNIKCNPMCYCEKGYARDSKNNCIPIHQCPKPCN